MSLLDALLLDPVRIDVYVALRQDTATGSGTQTDPYHAGLTLDSTTADITAFSVSGQDVTATMSPTTSLSVGDAVQVTGATDRLLNGVFLITSKTSTNIVYRTNEVATVTTGTAKLTKVTGFRFDSIMSDATKVKPNTCVHLGPGTFHTRGYYDGISGSWQMQAGLRLVGSGIAATTLRLLNDTAGKACYAIGHALTVTSPSAKPNRVDLAEVCELTIDVNMSSVSATSSAGAVRMMGNHARVTRVRAINFGTRDATKPCMVFAMLTGNTNSGSGSTNENGVVNCGIQECIAINPNHATTGPVTAFHVGGKEVAGTTEAVGLNPYIQDCYADFTLPAASGPTVDLTKDLRGISMAWCDGGVVQGNRIHHCKFGGPLEVTAASSPPTAFGARQITVRGNRYLNVALAIGWQMSSAGIKKLRVEDNSIALTDVTGLTTLVVNGTNAGVYGILLDDRGATSAPHGELTIRGNFIGYTPGASGTGSGVQVNGAASLLMAENLVDLSPADPLRNIRCAAVRYSENRSPAGVLITGFNWGDSSHYQELATESEDAFMISMLLES